MSEHLASLLAPIQEKQTAIWSDKPEGKVITRLIAANFIIDILGKAMDLSYGEVVHILAKEIRSQEVSDENNLEFAVAIAVAGIGQESFNQEFTRRTEEYYKQLNN